MEECWMKDWSKKVFVIIVSIFMIITSTNTTFVKAADEYVVKVNNQSIALTGGFDNAVQVAYNDNITLMGGGIEASADVTGTMTSTDLVLHIDVKWKEQPETPITVTFNGKAESDAITSVESDANAAVEYYNLNCVRVNGDNLSAGVYVRRQGNKVSKVLVK